MCPEWKNSFGRFLTDMGETWVPGLTLGRMDRDKNYSPENCRWETWKEQQNNRINNHILEHNGEKRNITQWAEYLGMSVKLLMGRITQGWSTERALTTPNE